MSAHHEEYEVPRPILIAAGCLLAFVIAMTAVLRLTQEPSAPRPVTAAEVISTRDLAFRDRAEGGIAVWDVHEERIVSVILPGDGGFIRGVLRSLTRERRQSDIGSEQPFRLTGYADGRISIQDLATGRVIDINAFGIDNARAFAGLLSATGDLS